jgi:outer membrane protein TolC
MGRIGLAFIIIIVGWVSVPFPVDAEEIEEVGAEAPQLMRLSLDECIEQALANSRKLLAERHRLDALAAQIQQAYWKPFSNISANFFATVVPDQSAQKLQFQDANGEPVGETWISTSEEPNDTIRSFRDADDWGPLLRFDVRATLPLYTFGKYINGMRALKAGQAAKKADYPRFRQQIRFQVTQAYYAIEGAREMLYTIDKGRGHLNKARKKVESDLENQEGTSTQIDLIKLKVFDNEITQYESQAIEIEHVALAGLRFLVGGEDRHQVDVLDVPQIRVDTDLGSLSEYKSMAIDNRPELESLRYAVKALESKVKFRKSEFMPDLVGILGFRYGWAPGRADIDFWYLNDRFNFGPTLYFGLSLDYKLDIGLDIYKLREAKAELAALTYDQKEALEGILLQVEKVYYNVSAAAQALTASQKSRRLVKGWISATVQNHATGLASAREVKDSLTEYFKVMASLHKLTNDYNVGMAELARVTGTSEKE